jgi:hypothetical protein
MKKTYFRPIQTIALIALSLLQFGCGTFDLGTVIPVGGQSVAQRDSDMAVCKVKAYEAANSNERQAGAFIAGMTIVGAPLAIEDDKRYQRKIFKECMEDKGYAVEPPVEKQAATPTSNSVGAPNSKTAAPSASTDGKARISIPSSQEWIDTPLTDELKKTGAFVFKSNYAIDAGMMISRIKTSYVKEPTKYVETTKSYLEAGLKNSQKTETKIVDINGTQYAQYEVSGSLLSNGMNTELKYLSYVVVDKEEIYVIRFWTLTHNFDFQRPVFEEKMSRVSVREPLKVFAIGKNERTNLTPNQIKQQCKSLGFAEGTDEYAACLGEILSREK